jgi:Ankyrin repeat
LPCLDAHLQPCTELGEDQTLSTYAEGWLLSSQTLIAAAFDSPSKLRLAAECGLQSKDGTFSLQYLAGRYADPPALRVAKELDIELNEDTLAGAIHSGRVSIVNYLIQEQHCTVYRNCGGYSARIGDVDMLQCLRRNGYAFKCYDCKTAARSEQLPALQYMMGRSRSSKQSNKNREVRKRVANEVLHCAASIGNIEMVQWLQQQQGVEVNAMLMQ